MEDEEKTDGLKAVAKEVIGWEDNKLFHTLKCLTTKPGQIITEFCRGEKQKYLSPVAYYFGVETLKSYLVSISGLSDFLLKTQVEQLRKNLLLLSSTESLNKLSTDQAANNTLTNFFSFFLGEIGQKIIALPILLLFTWLFYKKYNRSFKENSWFALYSGGHASLLSLPLLLCWYITKDLALFKALSIIVTISYLVWASKQFYNLRIRKAILLRILYFLTTVLIILLISYPIVVLTQD